jgi:hypothetical protein
MRGMTLWQIFIASISLCNSFRAYADTLQDVPKCAVSMLSTWDEVVVFLIGLDQLS